MEVYFATSTWLWPLVCEALAVILVP